MQYIRATANKITENGFCCSRTTHEPLWLENSRSTNEMQVCRKETVHICGCVPLPLNHFQSVFGAHAILHHSEYPAQRLLSLVRHPVPHWSQGCHLLQFLALSVSPSLGTTEFFLFAHSLDRAICACDGTSARSPASLYIGGTYCASCCTLSWMPS